VPTILGCWLAFFTAVCTSLLLLFTRRWSFTFPVKRRSGKPLEASAKSLGEQSVGRYVALLGLLDKSIFKSLATNFLLIVSALVSIFLIFTLFELIRFIAVHQTALSMVVRHLTSLL